MKRFVLVAILLYFSVITAEIVTYPKVLKNLKGIKHYNDKEYQQAADKFQENSLQHPKEGLLHFNTGNAFYKQGEWENAQNSYKMALKDNNNKELESDIYYNLGNVNFQQQKYKEAMEKYRQALQVNPNHQNARYNYELASRMLQKQQQQKQQNKQNQQKSDDKNKQDQKQQQKQESKNQEQQQKQQQQGKKEQQEKKDEKQQEQMTPEEIKNREEAEKILKALLQKEKEEQEKEKQKQKGDKPKSGKYW